MHAVANGLTVFLDNFAIKELAKGDPARRRRFISTLDRGVEVMFSVANAAELSGPQGRSFDQMRAFLDEIGPHWFPVEFDPQLCISRERQLKDPATCCFSERLLKSFVSTYIRRSNIDIAQLPAALPGDFLRLGLFMAWLAPQRQDIIDGKSQLGKRLKEQIMEHRSNYDKDSAWLDTKFPQLPFRADCPATFVHVNLVRLLILESKSRALTPNDGIDFGQAVIASAYSSIATLDIHWKRRIALLPQPNKLARIYYAQELDEMVRDIEIYLDRLALQRGRAVASTSQL
jgi:hypothetical protein